MSLLTSEDLEGMFESLGEVTVKPVTWGGASFPALLEREYTEVAGVDIEIGRTRDVITVPTYRVPSTRAEGDVFVIGNVRHKCIDYQPDGQLGTRLVLADA